MSKTTINDMTIGSPAKPNHQVYDTDVSGKLIPAVL